MLLRFGAQAIDDLEILLPPNVLSNGFGIHPKVAVNLLLIDDDRDIGRRKRDDEPDLLTANIVGSKATVRRGKSVLIHGIALCEHLHIPQPGLFLQLTQRGLSDVLPVFNSSLRKLPGIPLARLMQQEQLIGKLLLSPLGRRTKQKKRRRLTEDIGHTESVRDQGNQGNQGELRIGAMAPFAVPDCFSPYPLLSSNASPPSI